MTITAYDAAQYAASKRQFYGEMQQHKLMYYAQAWSLAWDGVPLFDEEIQAWKDGPVIPSLRHRVATPNPDVDLDERQKSVLDAVMDHYGAMSGKALGNATHNEEPWQDARGDLPEGAMCSAPISHESMRRTYSAQSRAGRGPQRAATTTREVADMDEVLRRAADAGKRWERTLSLLAQ